MEPFMAAQMWLVHSSALDLFQNKTFKSYISLINCNRFFRKVSRITSTDRCDDAAAEENDKREPELINHPEKLG